ncbi:MAG TPA: hypothetical protein VGG74_33570 [Kofleriaceae bacterium]|jgi:hypothetical protein
MRARAVLVAISLLGAPAFAQAPGATPPMGSPGQLQQPPPNARPIVERIKKQIRNRRDFELSDQLDLDPQTQGRMIAVFARYDELFDRALTTHGELQRRLSAADQIKDPKVLQKLIDDAIANQHAIRDIEDHRLAELRTILTPQQTARLIVVLPALERRLQNQLQKAINGNKPRRQPRRPALDDDDDD